MKQFYLNPTLSNYFAKDKNSFNSIMALQGTVYRAREGRSTKRVLLNNEAYFVKTHHGVGWKEIIKNLLQFRLPIISASNEWRALLRLRSIGIATMELVGYGSQGINPATKQSFLITKELSDTISLEDFCRNWANEKPDFNIKYKFLREVAQIARLMHTHGINHRDFYLCHFLIKKSEKQLFPFYLIDLHRAAIRSKVPQRWLIKDLAGLYFSSRDIGLTSRDMWRFMKEYRQKSLRAILSTEQDLWEKVKKRGDKTYQAHGK